MIEGGPPEVGLADMIEANGQPPSVPFLAVPLPLAQAILDILAQLPYGQVAEVANKLIALEVED